MLQLPVRDGALLARRAAAAGAAAHCGALAVHAPPAPVVVSRPFGAVLGAARRFGGGSAALVQALHGSRGGTPDQQWRLRGLLGL